MLTAKRLAELGLAVHWIRPPGSREGAGKAPVSAAWQQQHWQSPEELRISYRVGYNVGIRTGAVERAATRIVVADLDDGAAVQWASEHLPSTPLRVATRQGEHWYYLHPGHGVIVGNRAHVGGLRIDVRRLP